ncbi:MAG: MFS transporter [Brevibacillus sp.]|nr:MFS transporter [Brevibacillus sp.]
MLMVFIEYKVKAELREQYLKKMTDVPDQVAARGGNSWRFYEGLDQPCLFVESFEVPDEAVYREIKEWRTRDQELARYLVGGLEKMHVWAFCPLAPGDGGKS